MKKTSCKRGFTLQVFLRPLREKVAEGRMRGISQGFTLIELLVVVLIIGILAAVALPQYQVAVLKSRYSTLKDMVHSLEKAENVYYLANGEYALSFDALDIDIPAGSDEQEETRVTRTFSWGMCRLTSPNKNNSAVSCALFDENFGYIRYQVFLKSDDGPGLRWCQVGTNDLNNVANKVCKNDTASTDAKDIGDTYVAWQY